MAQTLEKLARTSIILQCYAHVARLQSVIF